MPGRVSIGRSAAIGWAVHPRLADYRVLVHVICGARVLCSVIANQAPLGTGNNSKSWFRVDLGSLDLPRSELQNLRFYAAEMGEYLESDSGTGPATGGRVTLESMLATQAANPVANGSTYLDVESCLAGWEIIDLFYRDFLGRPSDDKGLAEYTRQLQLGALTLEDIRGGIVSSQEYVSRRKDAARPPGAIFSDPLVHLIVDARRQSGFVPHAAIAIPVVPSAWHGARDNGSNRGPGGQDEQPLPDVSEIESPADSVVFGAGWHAAELSGGKAFRWMGRTALIQNPRPDLPLREVTVHVSTVYGARAPQVECYLDDVPASTRVVRRGRGFVLQIRPQSAHSGHYASLRIDSRAAGSPVQDGKGLDNRVLSLNVLRVVSRYHATQGVAADGPSGIPKRAAPYASGRSYTAGRMRLRRALRILQSLTGLAK
jgi:Domain of unknown function (DUF4214)